MTVLGLWATRTLLLATALTELGLAAAPAGANTLSPPQTLAWCQLVDGSTVSGPTQCEVAGAESVVLTLAPQATLSARFDSAPGFDTIGSVQYA
ncbi:MAG TPA: hypothetical protein VEI82_05150, partial [Myxococcota bacterium]|nr:hypothetical protein [Myxococcota bacterium]